MAQETTEVVDIMSLPQADSFSDTDTLILQKSSGATQRASSKKLKDYINSDFMTSVEVKEENLEQEYQKNKTALENYTEDKKSEMNAFVTQKESELNSQFGDIATNEQERKTNETNRVNAENKRTEDFTQLKQSLESAVQSASLLNVEVEETENSYSVKITDKNGVSKTSPNLLNTIGIGTVQTGAYEDGATASITGSFGNQKLNLRIPVGRPFVIKKAYASVSAMELSIKNDLDVGEFCIIDTGSVDDADTGKLYMRTDDEIGYSYLTDLSGAQGIQGPIGLTGATPNLTIGTVETGAEGSQATATITGTAENPILNLTIPRGMTGTVENISGASIPYSSSEDEKSIKDVVDDKLGKTEQASDSATVNGHTVESNVPANAQFTDTVPEVDAELSETSTNAVQNKVVNAAITKKADTILYDKSANTLYLKSGSTVLSSTEIKSGGGGGATITPKPTVNPQIENGNGKVIITWEDPTNTVIDGSTFSTWEGTKLVMKEDGYPTSPDDGTLLVDNTTRDKYKTTGFEKSGLTNDTVYYFALFPYSTDGVYNYDSGNRLLGEPTEEFKIVTFAGGTDKEIAKMIQAHYDNKINIADYWAVGDTRTVSLSAMAADKGVGESHREQDVQFVIGDFDHDDLATSINGHTKAAITLLQKNCLMDAANASNPVNGSDNTENGYMKRTNTNVGGWKSCARRNWCNNVYYNALPSAWKSIVKTVNKKSGTGGGSSSGTETTQDKIFLASEIEIFGSTNNSVSGEGAQYQYYKNATANRYKMPKWYSTYVSHIYWERSPCSGDSMNFCSVYPNGNANNKGASDAYGVAPCLCI